jgi:hypothetical protein
MKTARQLAYEKNDITQQQGELHDLSTFLTRFFQQDIKLEPGKTTQDVSPVSEFRVTISVTADSEDIILRLEEQCSDKPKWDKYRLRFPDNTSFVKKSIVDLYTVWIDSYEKLTLK